MALATPGYRSFDRLSSVVPFAAGQTVRIDLPRTWWLYRHELSMTGTVTVAGANALLVKSDSPLGLIRAVRLMLDGVAWYEASGPMLYNFARIVDRISTAPVAPAVNQAAHAVSAFINLGPSFFHLFNELDFLIPVNTANTVQLEIDCGVAGDELQLDPGPPATTIAHALNFQVRSTYHVPGKQPDGSYAVRRLVMRRGETLAITAANADAVYRFNAANVIYNGLMIRQMNAATVAAQVLVDTACTAVRIVAAGTDLIPWQTPAQLRRRAEREHGIAVPVGYIWIPFNYQGRGGEGIVMNQVGAELEIHLAQAVPAAQTSIELMHVYATEGASAYAVPS